MDYIISPWIFFGIGVIHAIDVVNSAVLFCLMMACTLLGLCYLDEISSFCRSEYEIERISKALKTLIPYLIVTVIGAIFIPSEKTMYRMLVAHYVTKQNVNITVEKIDQLADKLIEAIKESKQ